MKATRFRYFTDALTAIGLLSAAFPARRRGLWKCRGCGAWLGALDLEGGLTAVGSFAEEATYREDPCFGRVPVAVGVVLTEAYLEERIWIKCERCGFVNRRRRRS